VGRQYFKEGEEKESKEKERRELENVEGSGQREQMTPSPKRGVEERDELDGVKPVQLPYGPTANDPNWMDELEMGDV
jgi:hypothetical protein